MEIFPRDLGRDHYLDILRRRLSPLTGATAARSPAIHDVPAAKRGASRLARFWTRGLGLEAKDIEKVGALTWSSAPGAGAKVGVFITSLYLIGFSLIFLFSGEPGLFLFFLAIWLALFPVFLFSPRLSLKKAHRRALDATEVESLMPFARGRLDEAYLNLVRDALRAEIPSVSAQDNIRAGLRALGELIAGLPAERAPTEDGLSLRAAAQRLREQAARETDAIVRDSLLRQAATQEKRAGAADDTARLARRVQTLRREARVQIDTLRGVLVGFDASATSIVPHQEAALASATQLAEAVQRAAQEAQAASIARAELENDEIAALLGRPTVPPATQPQVQTLGNGAAPAPAPPQQPATPPQPPSPNRPWWRSGA